MTEPAEATLANDRPASDRPASDAPASDEPASDGPASDGPAAARLPLLRRAFRLSLISIALSGVLGGVAVVVGLTSNSLSLLGFGFDAAIDACASVALAWRFATEARHPHKTENVERIAEIVVGGVLLVLAAYLAINAVLALVNSSSPEVTPVGVAISIISLIALPALAIAKYRTARALGSGALRADSILTGVAAVLALVSLVGLLLTEAFGVIWADAVGALVVSLVLFREGWLSIRKAPIH
jgi:divalent metal cation (Fe/Co/Zn/Cd) transporter